MNNRRTLYTEGTSLFHRLDGSVKLLLLLIWTSIAFMFLDLRVSLIMNIIGYLALFSARLPIKKVLPLILFILIFNIFNSVLILIISPNYGSELTNQVTIFLKIGRFVITYETLFYLLTLSLKYLSLLPFTMIFIFTTHPSQFASSLNRIGINYHIAYAVNISLRYIPEVAVEFKQIKQAQEAKGVAFSKEETSFLNRLKNYTTVLFPMLTTSINRIDVVSNAMDLRGFGKFKKRTWFNSKPYSIFDILSIVIAVTAVIIAFVLSKTTLNYFWYPY